jgi:ABC-2 type transport system permease protein
MQLYWEVAKRGFSRYATYRSATVAGVFTNTIFGFVQAFVLLGLFKTRDEIGGFDATDAVTFTFITQGLLMVVAVFQWQEIALRIRTGDVATDLSRPVDFQAWWLAQDLGRALYHAVARGLPPVFFGALVFDLRVSTDPGDWLAFMVSVSAAVVVSFGIRFLTNLTAFWIIDVRGPLQVVMVFWLFFSGFIMPINFFPSWLETVARWSPFASVVQLPVEVLLGRHEGSAIVGVLLQQLAWAAILYALGGWALRAATRKLVIQGG